MGTHHTERGERTHTKAAGQGKRVPSAGLPRRHVCDGYVTGGGGRCWGALGRETAKKLPGK
jgi:hypothetical protein